MHDLDSKKGENSGWREFRICVYFLERVADNETHLFLGSDALIIIVVAPDGLEAAATGVGVDVTTDDGKRFAGLGGSGGGTNIADVTMAGAACEGGGGGGSGLCFVLTRFTTVACMSKS